MSQRETWMRETEYQQEFSICSSKVSLENTMACVIDGTTTYDQAQCLELLK